MSGLFWLTAALSLCGIAVVAWVVPPAPLQPPPPVNLRRGDVLLNPQLVRLNLGVFVLFICQTAIFVVVPRLLVEQGHLPSPRHWIVYAPVLVLSFAVMIPPMLLAERKGKTREVFLGAVALLFVAMLAAPFAASAALTGLVVFLLMFFIALNLLEALQPSLVSRQAPPHLKGFAMGVYNTTQAFGLFLGGILGGTLAKRFGDSAVFYVCAALTAVWFVAAWSMKPPAIKRNT